ncbi:hypothetical protein [Wielerella bovis]|uniref:hypothetical protein n=1 Tax=Wielerella bovis TaxID=2917790 RepID=UPI002019C726|nr:hypothetical protein [Wielerella bovis]ULJ66672.1 hypothetical protein MIS31_10555 [Wielerella bovis]
MSELRLLPVLGINNVNRVDNLKREGGYFVQDAVNVDIESDGRFALRRGWRKLFDVGLRDVWQSPLHGDVFAVLGNQWGVLNLVSGSLNVLIDDVGEMPVSHCLLNNRVLMACGCGLFVYDGVNVLPLGIDAPPSPWLLPEHGSLPNGTYSVAVAWLRDELESGLSPIAQIDVLDGGFSFTLPVCLDETVTAARVYLSHTNGGELLKLGDYALDSGTVSVVSLPALGRAAENRFMQPMPTGKFVQVWRGRVVTARANVLYFSQALAYHWHDARFDFVQLPQRITFVVAVESGLWVGQVTGVVFLSGSDLNGMQMVQMAAKKPIENSAMLLPSDELGEVSGGLPCAVWLAENGLVIGTASGQLVECHAGVLTGIAGTGVNAVMNGRRVFAAVQAA